MSKFLKRKAAALTAITFLASLFTAAPAKAETTGNALVRFVSSTVNRTVDPTTKEVQYLAGERISISVSASFKGSALSENNVASEEKLVVDSGLTFVGTSPRNEFSFFNVSGFYGNINQGFNSSTSNSSTSEITFTDVPTAINANFNYNATAVTDVTIKVEPTFTIGDYTYEADDFDFYDVYASTGNFMPGSKQNEPVLGRSIDSAIGFSTINACVNTTGLTAGDILEANFDVNDGTSQVGEKDYRWYVRNSQGMTQGPGGMDETFEVPVISDGYKLTFGVDVQISPVVDGKTYTFAEYKVVKQGSTANLLTHCKDTLATGTLSVSGSAVTGTLDSTPDGGGGMQGPSKFDLYSCALYAIADTGFVTPVKTASANLFGQFGPVTNPTCTIGNVASGTYKMGIRGISYSGIGSEKILSGSVTVGGAVTPPAKKAPKAPTVATKVNKGKTFVISLHATKGTSTKGANSDGLPTVVAVSSASKKFCSATKIVKSGKITGYTIKGLKAGNCSVVVTITGSSAFNALTKTTVVKVS
jgi:hypothetical protein